MATVYNKKFIKTDGSERSMKFVRLTELNDNDYITYGIPREGRNARQLSAGQETVWDLEKSAFRIFNWNTEQK